MPIHDADLLDAQRTKADGPNPADPDSRALLLAIFRKPTGTESQNIPRLVENVREWESFFHLAQEHGVLPMVFPRLRGESVAVPSFVESRLRAEYERNVLQCYVNATELIAILNAFERELIPAIPYKGIVLAASVYHDFTARPAGDLDLLVHQRHLAQASALLFERGYNRLTHVRADGIPIIQGLNEYQFERSSDGMQLELRWTLDLGHPGFKGNLGLDWIGPNRETTQLAGAEVPDLSPEFALLVLCMHGSKHAWERLVWICDVAQLLASSPDLDWKKVNHQARKSGLSQTLALGLLVAHRIVGATFPENLLHRFESNSSMSILAQHIQETLFDSPGSSPVKGIPYKVQLLEFRDRVRYFFSLNALRPNEADRAAFPLPKSLHFLYYLVRLFRVVWDRSAR